MKHAMQKAAMVIVLACSITATGNAAVINYDESVNGDLADVGYTFLGALGIGTNTVSGSMSWDDSDADFDDFAFAVPDGAVLDGISFAFTYRTTGVSGADSDYWLVTTPLDFLSFQNVDFLAASSPVSMFGNALPLGVGNYEITQVMINRDCASYPAGGAGNPEEVHLG